MAAIYCVSVFLFVYYFSIGYEWFNQKKFECNKLNVVVTAVLIRIFCLVKGGFSLLTLINTVMDFLTGYIIYKMAQKRYDEFKSLMCADFYVLNPVMIIFSCVWKQSLSAWGLLILMIVYCMSEKNMVSACICFSISQYYYIETAYLLPVFFLILVYHIKREKDFKKLSEISCGLVLPFILLLTGEQWFKHGACFKERFLGFINPERIAYNACNLWSMLGLNWGVFGTEIRSGSVITVIMLTIVTAVTFLLYHRWKERRFGYLLTMLISFMTFFLLGTGVHEYVLIGAVMLALVYFILYGGIRAYKVYLGVSVLSFFNLVYTCTIFKPASFNSNDPVVIITAFLMITGTILTTLWLQKDEKPDVSGAGDKEQVTRPAMQAETDAGNEKVKAKDWLIIGLLMIFFTLTSMPILGSHEAPKTTYNVTKDTSKEIILDLGTEKKVDHLSFFLGRKEKRSVSVSRYDEDKEDWKLICENQNLQSVFAWNNIEVNSKVRYLGIVCADEEAYFNELAIVGEDGQAIEPVNKGDYVQLFDEQNLYKQYPTYYDQTFFDEVYHARTAYEYIHHYISYENTHPPLGKFMISLGIRLFGMNPFGWRITGELIGILMIPLMYLFAKRLFKNTFVAAMTALLLTMDFMHYTLSKIATLDIIIGFFILLMYYFMYRYISLDFDKTPFKKSFIPLGLCGITMGVGIAVKWTGVYAGAGLAVIFFSYLYQTYTSFEGNKNILNKKIFYTLLYCVVFFIAVPVTIYCLSYIPFVGYRPYNNLFDKVLDNMQLMFNYHSKLKATHPYESWWYQWPWMKRPLFQAVTRMPDGKSSAISCFGNPLVWWPGFLAVLYTFKCWLWDKERKAGFLCISYSAQMIPWMFVTRDTFIYHYFPGSLFTILCSGYCIKLIIEKNTRGKTAVICYGITVVMCFILFYPAISGQWMDQNWARMWLRWLQGWVIT